VHGVRSDSLYSAKAMGLPAPQPPRSRDHRVPLEVVSARCYTDDMAERTDEYEVVCACGNRWRLQADEQPDTAECIACGAHATEIVDVGQVRPSY
jgi:hypothetical protein